MNQDFVKIYELGETFDPTGEPRVRLLEDGVTKLASNEIQVAWDKLKKNDNYAYLWVIACGAHEAYGCNNNGDSWWERDLESTHPLFTTNAHVFLHHVNKDPAKSIGVPIFSHYNKNMRRIELILQIDKSLPAAAETIRKINSGELISVSIGARHPYDECSICGKKSKSRKEYCDHLKYNLKKILPDGRQVFTYNPTPRWFDISIVHRPAFSPAFTLDKMASDNSTGAGQVSSAELGEMYAYGQVKTATISKVGDIVKKLDGIVAATKDDAEVNVLKALKDSGHLDKMVYPGTPAEIADGELTPGGMLRALVYGGAPVTLEDCACAAGRHILKDEFSRDKHLPSVFRHMPEAFDRLQSNPDILGTILASVLGNFNGEVSPNSEIVIRIVRPLAAQRITIIKQACDLDSTLEKVATDLGAAPLGLNTAPAPLDVNEDLPSALRQLMRDWTRTGPSKFDTIQVRGQDGKTYETTRWHAEQASSLDTTPRVAFHLLPQLAIVAAALGTIFASNISFGKRTALLAALAALGSSQLTSVNAGTVPYVSKSHSSMEGVPVTTMFYEAKKGLTKEAAFPTKYFAPALGVAVPAALGLDYAYNRFVKYKDDPYMEERMSPTTRTLTRAGKIVADSPASSLALGAVAGGGVSEALKILRTYAKYRK